MSSAPAERAERPASEVRLNIAEDWLVARPEGAIWWPDAETLIVSDLHLEKGSSFAAASGQLLPPYDTRVTLSIVEALCQELNPQRVLSLGDSFHDRSAELRLAEDDKVRIRALTGRYDWFWIEGNHDPDPPETLGGTPLKVWRHRSLVFRHEPERERGEIAGHMHPVAKISGRGRSVRRRCFITNGDHMILPALGTYTGGLNVRDPAMLDLFPCGGSIFAIGSDRVVPVAQRSLLPDISRAAQSGWRL